MILWLIIGKYLVIICDVIVNSLTLSNVHLATKINIHADNEQGRCNIQSSLVKACWAHVLI